MLRECLSIRKKMLKKGDWLIANARSNSGESLTGQGADPSLALGARIEKLREAEALLIESANALQGSDKTPENRKAKAIQRVVDLYEPGTPPLGLGMAALINRKLWSDEEKEAGIAAVAMGMIGITEGAIPFAAADPLRVIPCIIVGSMTAAVVASLGGVGDHAPHGGPIVLPVVDNRIMYVIAIVAGTIVTAALINTVKVPARKRTLQTTETPA